MQLFKEAGAAGPPIDEVAIAWPWILPPTGVDFEGPSAEGIVRVWPIARQSALGRGTEHGREPDVLCGRITLVFRASNEDRLETRSLYLPPPSPFAPDAVDTMWDSVCSFGVGLPGSVALQGHIRAGTALELSEWNVGLELLHVAYASMRDLMLRWPVSVQGSLVTRPIEMPGGREDARATDRLASRIATTQPGGRRPLPPRTVRRQGRDELWRVHAVATAAEELRLRLQEAGAQRGWHLVDVRFNHMLRTVAGKSATSSATPDPPMSCWPLLLQRTFLAIRGCLAELRAVRAGERSAPLTDLWRLYEAWVGVQVYQALVRLHGPPIIPATAGLPGGFVGSPGGNWHAKWEFDEGLSVTVCAQLTFGDKAVTVGDMGAGMFRSVTSDLTPDISVFLTKPEMETRLILFDAKKRSGTGRVLSAGEVGEATSKYLWGIRNAISMSSASAVEYVGLLSSSPGVEMHHPEDARAGSKLLLPILGIEEDLDVYLRNSVKL